MDARSGNISWGAGCGTKHIVCARRYFSNSVHSGRVYFANSIACALVRFRSLVRGLVKIAGHSNKTTFATR